MKIIILKDNLNNGLNIVSRTAGRNLTLPILNNILISAKKNFINLASTDLEVGIQYWSLAKIEKEGGLTVPAKILSNYVNFLPNKQLTIEVKNQVLHINCEGHKTQINGLDAQEYPIIPTIEDKNFIEIDTKVFCEGLAQVVDFTSPNQTRPELSGVYISFQKDRVQLAATDSFRLAEKTIYLKNNKEQSFILPQKAAREIVNIFSESKEKTKLYLSPNQALFELPMAEANHPQIQIVSRLIEGDYPDYQGIIPKKYEAQVSLSKNDFLNQIKTASVFSGKSNEVKIKTDPQKEGVEITAQTPELGENKGSLGAKIIYSQDKKETEVNFNYRFLVDGLSNIKSQKVVLELNGEEGPACLKPFGDDTYLYVVMPIKNT